MENTPSVPGSPILPAPGNLDNPNSGTTEDYDTGEGGHILIVDDMPANVRLLAGILKVAGYEVSTATNGTEALAKLAAAPPDVLLLDVMMPGMDGFEVCRHVKADPATAFLPVVMVTALQETSARIMALEAGADDFLTKPVDNTEVVARVKSLVRAKRQRDELAHAYTELKRLDSLRDSLALMLVHDLRTPLTTMLAPLEMLRKGQLGPLVELQQEAVDMCTRGGYRLMALVNELLDINKMESGEMKLDKDAVDMSCLAHEAIEEVGQLARSQTSKISLDMPPGLPTVNVDDDLLRRVLMNLIANALKFSPKGGTVYITARMTCEQASPLDGTATESAPQVMEVTVQDNGPGIPPEDQQRIFDKFGQLETRKFGRKTSTGLGLTFCKLAIEAHGGHIWVESEPGHGSTFKFTLPMTQAEADRFKPR